MTNRLFTDGIKDVIGNDPVLDQFDIAYGASFYGTSQDDYVTGTFLKVVYDDEGVATFNTNTTRGLVFSKLYADSQPAMGLSTAEISVNPYAAFREIPWSTKVSNMLRLTQHIDGVERIYDTCLPSLRESLSADGSEPWVVEHQNPSNNDYFLSPKKKFPTSKNCFMLFNDIKGGRNLTESRGINNTWTWSYPYEERYNPERRFLKVETQIRNIENVKLVQRFRPDIGYQEFYSGTPKVMNYLTPIFAGNYNSGSKQVAAAPGGRDTLRGTFNLPTGSVRDTRFDEVLGYSYTITADSDYSSLPTTVVTSSAVPSDVIKALYGFGDVNTIGYPVYNEVPSKGFLIYALNLGNLIDQKPVAGSSTIQTYCSHAAQATSPYYSNYFSINWAVNPSIAATPGGSSTDKYLKWGVIQATSKTPGTIKTVPYYYVSASSTVTLSGYQELKAAVAWPWRSAAWYPDNYTLTSPNSPSTANSNYNVYTSNGGQAPGEISLMCFDVTSSLAWQLSYERVIASDSDSYLQTYISREHSVEKDYDYNYGYDSPDTTFAYPEGWTSYDDAAKPHRVLETVYGDGGETSTMHKVSSFSSDIQPPGEYRINFAFIKPVDSLNTGIDRAFISAIDVRVWDPIQQVIYTSGSYTIDTTKRVGWNKEPEYRRKFVDPQEGITTVIPSTISEKNLDIQKYRAKAFGLAPVIRGWRHGLYNGLPSNTKSVFRRDRFGQFRDMLEQRIYTKCVYDPIPRLREAIPATNVKTIESEIKEDGILGSPLTVKFVKRKYIIGVEEYDKNVGKIYNEEVQPFQTFSQNLSKESISSAPFTDGTAKMRTEENYEFGLKSYNISAISNAFGNVSFT